MALSYLKIFADMEETLLLYSDEERGRLLSAMMAYSFRGEEPEFTGAERFVWPMIRKHIDSCEAQNEKLKANGKRGGRPETKLEAEEAKENQIENKENQEKPSETNVEAKKSKKKPIQEQDKEHVHEQEHVQKQEHFTNGRGKRTRFVPPTPEEVQAYMLENGGTYIQAARFHAFYSSKNWRVGRDSMSDWKAAARGWMLRDQESGYGTQHARPVQPQPATTNVFLQLAQEEVPPF